MEWKQSFKLKQNYCRINSKNMIPIENKHKIWKKNISAVKIKYVNTINQNMNIDNVSSNNSRQKINFQ